MTAGCKAPVVGAAASGQSAGGAAVEITGATVDATGHVRVALRMTDGGVPVPTRAAAAALAPTFTLAALSVHPVDGLDAWKSLLLTGRQTAPRLPPGGPGTPTEQVLANVRQPGAESDGTLEGSDGTFTYLFANALPAGFVPAETLRIGVWLPDVGTAEATSTFDFRPAGGAAAPRDTVSDANCRNCHAQVKSPRGAVGVRICLTCHTWQNSDPDTVDPAAMDGATPATDPNPLDFGRMVHRIHRGKNLPTLYRSSSAVAAPTLPSTAALPLPFFPGRNAAIVGRKYAIVGADSRETVFGHVIERRENGLGPMTLAEGAIFPRDLRDCAVCHEGAPQEYEVLFGVSRRTCSGCHPDVWFEPSSISDEVHFAHAGGPQTDDTECGGCHVKETATQPKVYAPIVEIHVPPHRSPRFDRPVVEIVRVENLRPGLAPIVKFKLYDRLGTMSPVGAFPAPAPEPGGSVLPRTMHYLAGGWFGISIAGPTVPAFGLDYLLSEQAGNPSPFSLVADAQGVFTYPFVSTVPATASGTWAVGIEARRAGATPHYDIAADEFRWPYTGETLTEPPLNPLVYVDTATGTFTAGVPDAAVPRRKIVAQEKCDRCHDPIPVHGKTRMRVEYCVICHGPGRTDWAVRPKLNGNVNLAATLDGIEERSIDFKVLIHRIHTGGRKGVASLEGIEPHVIYGRYGTVWFFDEALFPNDLANCTACHEGKSYTVEAVPADAAPTRANETATILHAGSAAHTADEPVIPPIQAACLGCHASGATQDHARRKTVAGVEQCAQCHVRGALSVEVAHGLAPEGAAGVSATWSSIAQEIMVPRCASAACHGGVPPAYYPNLDAATGWAALVGDAGGQPSQQASGMMLVAPYAPEESYLLLKIRGEGATVGGIATPMPIQDTALTPSEIAAIEAWIANGAPND
jgi:OmcA/MtrC family decaheme c-type cytochrome